MLLPVLVSVRVNPIGFESPPLQLTPLDSIKKAATEFFLELNKSILSFFTKEKDSVCGLYLLKLPVWVSK